VKQSFETSSGTVAVIVDEESRTVSAYRYNGERRAVAAAMESWDYADLAEVLTRQIGVSPTEADDIAAQVRAQYASLGIDATTPRTVAAAASGLEPLEKAGLPLRFVAVLLDAVIVLFPLAIVVGLLAGGGFRESGDGYASVGVEVGGNAFWALLAVGLGYYVICEALTGMTVGKRMVGIRVVDENGEHLSLAAAVVRNVLRLVDSFFFYLVGAIFALASPLGQRLGDRAAGTVVVRR
jgi:uncharacterized RDD family membrane protein YckC